MRTKIINIRLAILGLGLALFSNQAFAKPLPPPVAPVENMAVPDVSNTAKESKTTAPYPYKIQVRAVRYDDYVAYPTTDTANFDCPLSDKNVNGRTIAKYHDDFPIYETYEYSESKTRCPDLYYPYNYAVPK